MGEDASPEKGLLEKAATIKRFEYPPLSKELKKQTSIAEKQYRELDEVRGLNKTELNKTELRIQIWFMTSLILTNSIIGDEEFNELLDVTKYKHFQKFFAKINELRKVKSRTEDTEKNALRKMQLLKYLINQWKNWIMNTTNY